MIFFHSAVVVANDSLPSTGTPLRYGAYVRLRSYKGHFLCADSILGIGVKKGEPDSSCRFKVVNLEDPTSHALVEYGVRRPIWLQVSVKMFVFVNDS